MGGMVIVDECHHVSAVSFERVLKSVTAKYVYGLTATPKRRDGHHPIITLHCGPVRYKDDAKAQAQRRPFGHFVIPRFTSFRVPFEKDDAAPTIQELYSAICESETRNELKTCIHWHATPEGFHNKAKGCAYSRHPGETSNKNAQPRRGCTKTP